MVTLRYDDIEAISDQFLTAYFQTPRFPFAKVDIEAFAKDFLHLDIQYAQLSYGDEIVYGVTAFENTVLALPEKKPVVFIEVPENTIVLDVVLKEPSRAAQRAFTIAHECGHQILAHLSPEDITEGDSIHAFRRQAQGSKFDRVEWQCNIFASTLLMPKFLVESMQHIHKLPDTFTVYDGTLTLQEDKTAIRTLAGALGVSFQAMLFRLKKMGKVNEYSYLDYIYDADEERRQEEYGYGLYGRSTIYRKGKRRARPAQRPIAISCDGDKEMSVLQS